MYAECWEKPAADQCPSYDGTQDGIAIVEEVVWIKPFTSTGEAANVWKHLAPIVGGGSPFEVGAVAGTYLGSPLEQIPVLSVVEVVQ